jgi:plasmid stabilization system protein ParE
VRIVWSPVAALEWAQGLFELVRRLREFPDRGRVVPELGQPSIRELIYGDYRVVYRIEGSRIGVLTVRHGRRQFEVSEPRRSARA